MPGHMKQTNATRPSWKRGEAYQGMAQLPTRKDLYIHPAGRMASETESRS